MTKPDWCPEDIWEQTDKIRNGPFHWKGPEEVAVIVARAILAERERCVKACEHEIDQARSFGPHHIPIISSVLKAIRAS